MTVCWFC